MGGTPEPFDGLADRDLNTGTDSLGPYFFAERRLGADTLCVLAIRRLDSSARPLPVRADALDVMLRNCVRGSREEALAPISAARLAVGASGGLLNLSPHAAPQGFGERG
jgi:hypothetical protein